MSYFVIKGPGDFQQYLCPFCSHDCPQWWHEREKAMSFPDADSARAWLRTVQERYRDHGSFNGRVVRVNTVRDWKAERGQLRAEVARLRGLVPTCKAGPKACDAEIATLRIALDEIASNAENLLRGGLPHFSREEFADTVAYRARHALSPNALHRAADILAATIRASERGRHDLGACCIAGRCDGELCACECHPVKPCERCHGLGRIYTSEGTAECPCTPVPSNGLPQGDK